ncbi:MAG TPA: glycosyltransferase [Candidatus Krumholzibacteriaceae bacterium]|nr:glycosyltransferase [Candidatus Krumholzibacteriaceae bacterium]
MEFQICVIIPTVDRSSITLETLRSFEDQTSNDFEVIVIDQTSGGSTPLSDFSTGKYHYRYISIKRKGLPNARNVGAEASGAEILLFVDDDVIPSPELIDDYINEFKRQGEEIWVIGGKIYEAASKILNERENISGGYITFYGKTLKNFYSDSYSECQWAAGGNFAVRRDRFFEAGGFDTNYIGTAIMEDGDFGFSVRKHGGRVLYSPKPEIEHLRASSGGTRRSAPAEGMYYRAHNTAYFFRKFNRSLLLPIVFLYLNGVALKDLLNRRHGFKAFYYTWSGFLKGLTTKLTL